MQPVFAYDLDQIRRGDIDDSGDVTISDPLFLLGGLFGGNALCDGVSDYDRNGTISVSDVFLLLQELFFVGPPELGTCEPIFPCSPLDCPNSTSCF